MCKTLILRYSCTHDRLVTLSRCRHTHTRLTVNNTPRPACKGPRKPTLLTKLETACPTCYVYQSLHDVLESAFGSAPPRAMRQTRWDIEAMSRMIRGLGVRQAGEKEEKVGEKRVGGSPLRKEVKVEDLDNEKEEEEEAERKDSVLSVAIKTASESLRRRTCVYEPKEREEQEEEKEEEEDKDRRDDRDSWFLAGPLGMPCCVPM